MTCFDAELSEDASDRVPVEPVRILLVDDHDMFTEILLGFLAAEDDFNVVGTATRGSEAVTKAERLFPDVVLLDFELPDQDGASVAAEIKAVRPETRVIMLTGRTDDATLVAAIEAGCSGFLSKDKRAGALVDAIRAAHAGEAVIGGEQLARLLPQLRRTKDLGASLSTREHQVLALLAAGRSNRDIADELVISVATVRNHVHRVITKLGSHSKLEAVAKATRGGLIRLRPEPSL